MDCEVDEVTQWLVEEAAARAFVRLEGAADEPLSPAEEHDRLMAELMGGGA